MGVVTRLLHSCDRATKGGLLDNWPRVLGTATFARVGGFYTANGSNSERPLRISKGKRGPSGPPGSRAGAQRESREPRSRQARARGRVPGAGPGRVRAEGVGRAAQRAWRAVRATQSSRRPTPGGTGIEGRSSVSVLGSSGQRSSLLPAELYPLKIHLLKS